ncbi:KR domain-containing protein [Streptomyces sp. M19]
MDQLASAAASLNDALFALEWTGVPGDPPRPPDAGRCSVRTVPNWPTRWRARPPKWSPPTASTRPPPRSATPSTPSSSPTRETAARRGPRPYGRPPGAGARLAGRRAVRGVDPGRRDQRRGQCRGRGRHRPRRRRRLGLLRSAQSEHPGRITLIDVDAADPAAGHRLLPGPGVRRAPTRRTRRRPDHPEAGQGRPYRRERHPADWTGRVLITGGTGALGALVARHLVTEHGARDLLLLSRRGADAPAPPS